MDGTHPAAFHMVSKVDRRTWSNLYLEDPNEFLWHEKGIGCSRKGFSEIQAEICER